MRMTGSWAIAAAVVRISTRALYLLVAQRGVSGAVGSAGPMIACERQVEIMASPKA